MSIVVLTNIIIISIAVIVIVGFVLWGLINSTNKNHKFILFGIIVLLIGCNGFQYLNNEKELNTEIEYSMLLVAPPENNVTTPFKNVTPETTVEELCLATSNTETLGNKEPSGGSGEESTGEFSITNSFEISDITGILNTLLLTIILVIISKGLPKKFLSDEQQPMSYGVKDVKTSTMEKNKDSNSDL